MIAPQQPCNHNHSRHFSPSLPDSNLLEDFQSAVDLCIVSNRSTEAVKKVLAASRLLALEYSRQRAYLQVLSCLKEAIAQVTIYEQQHANDEWESIALGQYTIECVLLYAKACARQRQPKEASEMLRECRRLIHLYTPYKTVKEYQEKGSPGNQLKMEKLEFIQKPAPLPETDKTIQILPAPVTPDTAPTKNSSLSLSAVTQQVEVEPIVAGEPKTLPLDSIECRHEDVHVVPEKVLFEPLENDSFATVETYTGDSSDSDSLKMSPSPSTDTYPSLSKITPVVSPEPALKPQSLDEQHSLVPPERIDPPKVVPPYFTGSSSCLPPSSPSKHCPVKYPHKSCLRSSGVAPLVNSFAEFAVQSTLSAAMTYLTPKKRVSFNPTVIQEHEKTQIKAFVSRQKLKTLRDKRVQVKSNGVVSDKQVTQPVRQRWADRRNQERTLSTPTLNQDRPERIKELSSKLRETEQGFKESLACDEEADEGAFVASTPLTQDDDVPACGTSSTHEPPSLVKTTTRTALAVGSVFANFVASVILKPSHT